MKLSSGIIHALPSLLLSIGLKAKAGNLSEQPSSAQSASFDPQAFVTYYERNYTRPRPLPQDSADWPELSGSKRHALRDFIGKLSFGEAAEGRLATRLASLTADEADRQSLYLYIRDEERHGDELFDLADRLALGLDRHHPDRGAKIAIRVNDLFNFGRITDTANMILVGEVEVLALYRILAERVDHPLVSAVMRHIIRDEAGHIRYHGERIHTELHRAGYWGRLKLKLTHLVGLLAILLSTAFLLRRSIFVITGLGWPQVLAVLESDYNKYFKDEMAFFRSNWVFRFLRLLPLR